MASSVDRRIEGHLTEDMGHFDLASLIRLRSTAPIRACGQDAAPTGRTHDRNSSATQTREKTLASRGPSTHVLGPREARTGGSSHDAVGHAGAPH
jgi:hypothetical protein